ncbi:MAG: hypothetical protein HC821_03950, partial [Lewinella sp.]|nr:hypothetical protein [Lewinella sp.]
MQVKPKKSIFAQRLSLLCRPCLPMLHPDTELRLIDALVGYGVFATKTIPRGTITYVKDDLETAVSPNTIRCPTGPKCRPSWRNILTFDEGAAVLSAGILPNTSTIAATATAISTGYGFELAIRDIQAGEQITD